MRSRSTKPMSLRRTLPLASVAGVGAAAGRPSMHRSWPAPSATTMTACARSASLRSRWRRNPPSPSRRSGTSGMSTKFASVDASAAWQAMKPECRPISFTRPMPLSRPRRLDVRAANGLDRGGEGALEAEAAIDEVDVVVDGLRDADDARSAGRGARSRRRSSSRRAACRRRRPRTARRCPAPPACRPSRRDPGCRATSPARCHPSGGSRHRRRAEPDRLVAVARHHALEAVAKAEDVLHAVANA